MGLQDLSLEILCLTFRLLDYSDILSLRRACRYFNQTVVSNFFHITTICPYHLADNFMLRLSHYAGEDFISRLLLERMKQNKASNIQVAEIVSQLTALSGITADPNCHVTDDSCRRAISVALTVYYGQYFVLKHLSDTKSGNDTVYILDGDFLMVVAAWLGLTTAICKDVSNCKRITESHSILGSALYAAAYNDDELLARFLIDNGVDPYRREGSYGDALQLAAYRGSEKVARLISNVDEPKRRRVEAYGPLGSPLHAAAESGHKGITQLLLQRKNVNWKFQDQFDRTPLHLAARNGHNDIVGLLLEIGSFNPNILDEFGDTPLSTAVRGGHKAATELLLEYDSIYPQSKGIVRSRETRSRTTASKGYSGIVDLVLSGFDVDVNPTSDRLPPPLVRTARMKHVEAIELLLERDGAFLRKSLGAKLFRWAVLNGLTKIARLLLHLHQTNPNCRLDHKYTTPLHHAALYNQVDLVRILLEHRDTDPNRQDSQGITPLFTATMSRHMEIVFLILSDGRTNA